MENKIAKFFSIVFHPVFIPIITVHFIFQTNIYIAYTLNDLAIDLIYSVVIFNTCLIPIVMTYYLYKKGFITSMEMNNRQERWFPFIMSLAFYLFTYYLLNKFNFPPLLLNLMLGSSIALVVFLIANAFYKISAHMLGVGGLIGALIGLIQTYMVDALHLLYISIAIAGLVAFSRLKLNAHTPFELASGLLVGAGTLFLAVYFRWMI